MTLSDNEKKAIIEYRIKQAFDSADVAEFLILNQKIPAAVNRIYYSVFYSLLALALQFGYKTSKHTQLIGWFNKKFIASGEIEKKFGRILRDCYNYRISADYDSFVSFAEEDIQVLLSEMRSFLVRIDQFIKENG
jgi:uncharacterized protein (UPF0332 family)